MTIFYECTNMPQWENGGWGCLVLLPNKPQSLSRSNKYAFIKTIHLHSLKLKYHNFSRNSYLISWVQYLWGINKNYRNIHLSGENVLKQLNNRVLVWRYTYSWIVAEITVNRTWNTAGLTGFICIHRITETRETKDTPQLPEN